MTEGVSGHWGDVAPLGELVELKRRYRFRLLLDESFSLGTLGRSGKGALEEFGVERKDVEVASADLANAIATVGGFCVGEVGVVSHQRLSGAGYCFSASQPPYMAVAATEALNILEEEGEGLVTTLRQNIKIFQQALDIESVGGGWQVNGSEKSPLMHIRCASKQSSDDIYVFESIHKSCLANRVLVGVPKYVENETFPPPPSVRIAISVQHSHSDLVHAASVLRKAILDAI